VTQSRQDRITGAVLYAAAACVLVAGVVWWALSAPQVGPDPQLAAWRAAAERLLPDAEGQAGARTFLLGSDQPPEESTDVEPGSFELAVVCSGHGEVRVRLSVASSASGELVQCAEAPTPMTLSVQLADQFTLSVAPEVQGVAIFRWRLLRVGD
jgi:hypothetical protein